MEQEAQVEKAGDPSEASATPPSDILINASGHRQELERNFHLINICGLGITSGNTWLAVGGSIVSSICILVIRRLMIVRLLQFTMEVLRVLFTNCKNFRYIICNALLFAPAFSTF